MILNEYGKIFENIIQETTRIRKEIILDEYVIMPNHVHVLVFVKNTNPNKKTVGNAGMRSGLRERSGGNEYPGSNERSGLRERSDSHEGIRSEQELREQEPHTCGPYVNENIICEGRESNPVRNAGMRSLGNDKTKNYISNYIQGLKSSFTREIRKKYNDYEFAWQKSFYDVIVRNDDQLVKSREYISLNPEKWEQDVNNNKNTGINYQKSSQK